MLLSTSLVQRVSFKDQSSKCLRVILDTGSQTNLITEKACTKLGLSTQKVEIFLIGINNTVSNIKQRCSVNNGSFYNPFDVWS